MNTNMAFFSNRTNLEKSQHVKLKISLKTYNIFDNIVIAQQSLPTSKVQHYFPSVNVSRKFQQSLQTSRRKRAQPNLKIKAIENVIAAKNETHNNNNQRENVEENIYTGVKCRRERYNSENNELTGVRNNRRASELVDQLLLDIYGRTNYSSGRIFDTEYGSSTSFKSVEKFDENVHCGRLILKDTTELCVLIGALTARVTYAGNLLVKQLKKREALGSKQEKLCNVITAHLQAFSGKRSEDTNMRFSPSPVPGDSGFSQWRDAMKMVAKLPGGIPPEFRKKLWLALAEKHLQNKGVNWSHTERLCFNEWSNPDDNELGVQIVKDLHRTGCSLFCGAAGQENQALLKRVLLAYARWNKSVGYCQGFNMLAALILQVMDKSEIDSVKVMIYLIEGVLPESYFANNLRGLSVDMVVFRDLLRMRLPHLSKHLEALQNDAREGNSYEPPLTNVFTMQWFLTLFCNCLPQATVLRVWDLIFLEGNEILLRTAIAIWEKLSDRILAVNSADEFYSIMGVLTREMLEFGLVDSNTLVKSIVAIGACAELNDMRDRYLYNITPWTQSVQTAAKKGFKLFYSDDDDVESDNDEKAAVTAVYGMSIGRKKERSMSGNVIQPYAHGHPDRERLALDISALKKQYAKLRERQRQAHIILQAACARQPMGQSTTSPPIAMNHLLLGKNAIVNARGRRLGPPKGAIPPVRTRDPMKKQQQGETIHWKDTAKIRYPRRPSYVEESVESKETFMADSDSSSSYSENDSSSTSTELCDEPERMSDFDSDDKVGNTPVERAKSTVDTVRTKKELKNTINSEMFVTEDDFNKDKCEASVCVSSEAKRKDIEVEETVNNEEHVLFSEFKSSAAVNSENVDDLFEFKSTNEENVTIVTSELDLCAVISESTLEMSEIDSDIFSNPVFYSGIGKEDRGSSGAEENYVEAETDNGATSSNYLDVDAETDKCKLDGLEESRDIHIDIIPSGITEHNYKFQNPSEFNQKTPEELKLCEDTIKIASEETKVSSEETNLIDNDTSPLEKQSVTSYFDSSPIKPFDNFEASSSGEEIMTEKRKIASSFDFKLDDHMNKRICDELMEEESKHFDISPVTYNLKMSLQNVEISSQISLFTLDNIEATGSGPSVSDTNEEQIKTEQSQNLELSENKYYTNIEITPEEDSTSRSIASDKNVKIQAMLNENSDILKGYQMSSEEKRTLEFQLDETTKVLVEKRHGKENYLLESDPEETNAVLVENQVTSTREASTKGYDFEHFLEEQVKLLKQNSSDKGPSPKEDAYTRRSSEEKLRRHRSYEESTKNYMDRSTFYKQTSFDIRPLPIEEWTPYQFKADRNKEREEIQVNVKTTEICASELGTFDESLRDRKKNVDTKLDETPVKEESSEEIVETLEWIPYNFEENKIIKLEEPQTDTKFNKYANTLDLFEDSGVNEENMITIDVKLAETPVKEEICKEPVTKQSSIDLLTVDDTRLEAGRKNSARALKIIQENSMILHRILQHSKSSDKEDSEDELSRSPISKTFKSESLLSREERTDEDRSSRDGDEDLESGTEFSLSPAVLEEENDSYVRKSTEETFSYDYRMTDENLYEKLSDKCEKRPRELCTLEKKDTTDKFETEFPVQTENQFKLSSDYQRNEVDNVIVEEEIISKQYRSENEEDNLEQLPEIASYSRKKVSVIDSESDKRNSNDKLERRYSSWHEYTSPDVPTLSRKQFSSSFSFRTPEEDKSDLTTYSNLKLDREDFTTSYLQKSPEKVIKTSSNSDYNLDKYKPSTYSERIREEINTTIETRNDEPVYQKEESFTLSKGTNDYLATSVRANDEETFDNNAYSSDKFQSSAQSRSYSKSYSEFQYNRNRLTIDLSRASDREDYSTDTASPKHLSCLQFATDNPCTSKALQFSPICVKDKTTLSPASPSCSNTKYSFNLPTLSAPKRTVKSPLSPAKSFNPFPVQPTTRQPKEVGVRLGLYKDLSPLKSPAK